MGSSALSLIVLYTIVMKYKKIVLAAILLAVVVLAGFAVWRGTSHNNTSEGPQTIRGRVAAINNGCFADGGCSVTLDDSRVIITGCGLMANGRTCKSYDQSKLHSGQQIEASVMKGESGTYNLECASCTIRVIE